MQQARVKFPTDGIGRLVGFLFLALIPLVTLIPVTPVAAWLTQDLVLRWVTALIFFLCLLDWCTQAKTIPPLQLDFPNLLVLLISGWVLLSVKNSQQPFDSYYSFKSLLALVLCWLSFRMIWSRWPELY